MLQAVQKLPPSLIRRVVNAYSEARLEPTDSGGFNDWLEDKFEAQERMIASSENPKS